VSKQIIPEGYFPTLNSGFQPFFLFNVIKRVGFIIIDQDTREKLTDNRKEFIYKDTKPLKINFDVFKLKINNFKDILNSLNNGPLVIL